MPHDTMLAAVLRGPRDLVVMHIPRPTPGADQVLLQVTACGICGSDLRYYEGENPWAKHTLGYEPPNPPDMVLGHEITGVHEGSRVGVLSFRGCGQCLDCRRGQENLCAHTAHLGHGAGWDPMAHNPGGMAQWCRVWRNHLYPLPYGISGVEGTLLDGLGVAVHAVRHAGVAVGSECAVLGAGPIGLCVMQVARAVGAGRTWVTDVYPVALECARALGATEVRSGHESGLGDLAREIMTATGGRGLDAVFDTTGVLSAQEFGLRTVARGGCLVLMAGLADGLRLSPAALAGERRITTCSNNLYADFQTGLDLLATGQVRVGPMITHRFPLEQAVQAFEVARNKATHGALKVIIEPNSAK